ncbi:MAG: hypothetical protein ACI97A_003301 [Planctomycetota bacterium]|jgi:hypothetical protein
MKMTTRRHFLSFLGTLPISAYGIMNVVGDQDDHHLLFDWLDDPIATHNVGSEQMDEALEMLSPYAASFRGGLSNHGPMNAEAMVALGHHDAVKSWVENYRRRLEKRIAPKKLIEKSKWREALGDESRSRDWDRFFERELAEAPWRKVVGLWVPLLAPGIAASGLHGVIRVGHAACSLSIKENKVRLDELARALGYWAATYLTLPGKYTGVGKLSPTSALKKVEQLPRKARVSHGLITTQLKDLVGFEPFSTVVNLVDPTKGSPNFMSDLLATFSGILINTKASSFDFLHAVTGAAAIRELLPHVSKAERPAVMAYSWQAAAAMFARYGQKGLAADIKTGTKTETTKVLAKLAVATGDEHSIKLVSACHREWLRNPDPRLLAAAATRLLR